MDMDMGMDMDMDTDTDTYTYTDTYTDVDMDSDINKKINRFIASKLQTSNFKAFQQNMTPSKNLSMISNPRTAPLTLFAYKRRGT